MYCPQCGVQNPANAAFCSSCGVRMALAQPAPPAVGGIPGPPQNTTLAGYGKRIGSSLIDIVLQGIPYVGIAFSIGNMIGYRRGMTLGLAAVRARIVRENGDVSGFFHTAVRGAASALSLIPLGFGYWSVFWDPHRQTWHDKMMGTYVVENTPELSLRHGTNSTAAVVWFWVLLVVGILLAVLAIFLWFLAAAYTGMNSGL